MKARTRIATVLASTLVLFGLGAGIEASTASAAAEAPASSTNACVVVPSLNLAACLGRF